MPGVWLGENEIPTIKETSKGVFEFSLYKQTALGRRITAFSLLFGFASALCIPGLIFAFNAGWPFVLVLGFYLAVGWLLGWTIFGHSEIRIDTNKKETAREYYVFGRKVSLRSRILTRDDRFVVYCFRDEHCTGADHVVYARVEGIDRCFVTVHLPTASRSDDLIRWLDNFSQLLEIRKPEYQTIWQYFARLFTFRIRSL